MAKIRDAVTTYAGRGLISEALAGQAAITFTRIAAGSGAYDGTEDLRAMTSLKNEQKELNIENIDRADQTTMKIVATLSSQESEKEFGLTEIGVFAKKTGGEEVLHSIIVMEIGDYMPEYSEAYKTTTTFTIYCAVDSESEVVVEDYKGQYATRGELLEQINNIQKQIKELGKVKFGPEDAELNPEDTLFIIDGMMPTILKAAAYSNMIFSASPPAEGKNVYWAEAGPGKEPGKPEEVEVTQRKLSVSEEPTPDADFFAQITK